MKRKNNTIYYNTVKHQRLEPCSLLNIGDDCLKCIVGFLDTKNWLQFSYTCKQINEFKKDSFIMKYKDRTFVRNLMNSNDDMIYDSFVSSKETLYSIILENCTISDRFFDVFKNVVIHLEIDDIDTVHPGDTYTINTVLKLGDTMRYLSIKNMIKFDANGLQMMKNLTKLTIENCESLEMLPFDLIPNIKYLELTNCGEIVGSNFHQMKNITELNIIQCDKIKESDLYSLNSLQHLIFLTNTHVTDKLLEMIGSDLKTLNISHNRSMISDDGIKHLTKIEDLALMMCNITDESYKHLKNTPLKYLGLACCRKITDEFFIRLGTKDLRNLLLFDCDRVTFDILKHFQNKLDRFWMYVSGDTSISKDITPYYEHMTNISMLHLNEVDIHELRLKNFKRIKIITFTECVLSDDVFYEIPCKMIQVSIIMCKGITSKFVEYIGDRTRQISINDEHLNDDIFDYIKEIVDTLILFNCRFVTLYGLARIKHKMDTIELYNCVQQMDEAREMLKNMADKYNVM